MRCYLTVSIVVAFFQSSFSKFMMPYSEYRLFLSFINLVVQIFIFQENVTFILHQLKRWNHLTFIRARYDFAENSSDLLQKGWSTWKELLFNIFIRYIFCKSVCLPLAQFHFSQISLLKWMSVRLSYEGIGFQRKLTCKFESLIFCRREIV